MPSLDDDEIVDLISDDDADTKPHNVINIDTPNNRNSDSISIKSTPELMPVTTIPHQDTDDDEICVVPTTMTPIFRTVSSFLEDDDDDDANPMSCLTSSSTYHTQPFSTSRTPHSRSHSIPIALDLDVGADKGEESGTDEELQAAFKDNIVSHIRPRTTPSSAALASSSNKSTAGPSDRQTTSPTMTAPSVTPAAALPQADGTSFCQPRVQSASAVQLMSVEQANALQEEIEEDADDSDTEIEGLPSSSNCSGGEAMEITTQFARDLASLSTSFSNATLEMPTPTCLAIPLLKHQRQALAWMVRREDVIPDDQRKHPRGGILADDQGFGKTLSFLALMASNTPQGEGEGDSSVAWGNLVVAPTSILKQWAAEINDRFEETHRPSVLIYHGPKRTNDPKVLTGYDVVITSYGVLLQEYPKIEDYYLDPDMSNGSSRKKIQKRRKPGPLFRVKWFRVILDEAQAIKNRHAESHKAAVSLHAQCRWAATGTPIQNTIDDIYSLFLFIRYHFVNSHADWRQKFKIPLERSVRHVRREQVFAQFQALVGPVLLRRAKNDRVDGKPIVPLPGRNIRVVDLEFTKTEKEHYQRQELLAVQSLDAMFGEADEGGRRMGTALLILLRLRQACNHPKLCNWNSKELIKFSDDELDAAEVRMKGKGAVMSMFNETVKGRLMRELKPGAGIHATCPVCMDVVLTEGIVTRCGHVFCTSDFTEWSSSNDNCPSCRTPLGTDPQSMSLEMVRKEVHATHRKKERDEEVRARVKTETKDEVVEVVEEDYEEEKHYNSFADELHGKRKKRSGEDSNNSSRKRRRIGSSSSMTKREDEQEDDVEQLMTESLGTSTKIKTFIAEYKAILETTDDKVLVFSQWARMLDLIEEKLCEEGFEFTRFDGKMNVDERAEAVKLFQTRSKCRLMIISLKAGSTGLNLTAANRVFLFDSWWNPAVEEQAIDRVHRIGQKKDVQVVKFKIVNSVEERIFAMQDKKRAIADAALGKEGLKIIGRRMLTFRDIMSLFTDVYNNVSDRAQQTSNPAVAAMVQGLQVQLRNDGLV